MDLMKDLSEIMTLIDKAFDSDDPEACLHILNRMNRNLDASYEMVGLEPLPYDEEITSYQETAPDLSLEEMAEKLAAERAEFDQQLFANLSF